MGIVTSVYRVVWGQKQIQDEGEIQTLKNKLRVQKSSTDAATAEQVAQIEAELNEDWQEKLDKMLKATEDKHKRALRESEEEKAQALERAKELDNKNEALKTSNRDSMQKCTNLQSELEELKVFKEKYENLRSQASTMKEKYEERISELEDEKETLEEKVEEVQTEAAEAVAAASKKTAPSGGSGGTDPQELAAEVKKIMSSVYHNLRGEFETDDSYKGSEVMAAILNTIKSVTLKLVESQGGGGGGQTAEEEDEDEEDESEEEEEDAVEEKPVVVETMSREVNHGQSAAAPPKQADIQKPKDEADGKNKASIEDQIMSQLIGSTEVSSATKDDKPSPTTKEKEPVKDGVIEPVIAASAANITGDRGNIHYSAELDKTKAPVHREEVVEPVIAKSTDHITGDKGNIYYSAELDKTTGTDVDKSKEKTKAEGEKEKDKSEKKDNTEENTGLSAAEIEAMFYSSSASSTTSGNPQHSTKLDKKAPSKGGKVHPDAPVEIVEEPMISSASGAFTMGGNPYYSQNLDQKSGKKAEKKEVQAEVIEPMMASSTAASYSQTPSTAGKKHTVVEPTIAKATTHITGDKGNRYYSEELDKSRAPVVEPMLSKSKGHPTGDKGNPHHTAKLDQSTGKPKEDVRKEVVEPVLSSATAGTATAAPPKQSSKDIKKSEAKSDKKAAPVEVVEPMITASSGAQNMGGNPHFSEKLNQKGGGKAAVVEPKMEKSKNYPTGDKGNVHHSAKLDQSKPKPKDAPIAVTEPVVVRSTGHPTGDKGNPHHTAELDKSVPKKEVPVEVVESMVASSSSSTTMAGNPHHSSKLGPTTGKTGGKGVPVEVVEPMIARSTGTTSMAANVAPSKKPDQKHKKGEVVEPMISKKTDHVTGDRGNIYHTAKLDASSAGKKPDKPTKPSATSKPVAVEPVVAKSTGHKTGDKGNPYHTAKLDKGKEKDQKDKPTESKDPLTSQVIPSMPSMEPPPLDDTDDKSTGDNPLFGDDDTVLDTFGTDFKPKEEEKGTGNLKDSKKDEKKSDKKLPSKAELLTDDSIKEKPPPLFGDEEDDDLDWLS